MGEPSDKVVAQVRNQILQINTNNKKISRLVQRGAITQSELTELKTIFLENERTAQECARSLGLLDKSSSSQGHFVNPKLRKLRDDLGHSVDQFKVIAKACENISVKPDASASGPARYGAISAKPSAGIDHPLAEVVVDSADSAESESSAVAQYQEQVLQQRFAALEREVITVDEIMQERDEEMRKIQSSLLDVHSMLRELVVMTTEQGVHIDRVADNISKTEHYTKQGVVQLEIQERKRSARRRCFFTLLCIAVTVLSIYLIVVLL